MRITYHTFKNKQSYNMKIPYNIFIFLWCIIGIGILGFSFITDIYKGQISFNSETFTQFLWFLVLILYSFNYIKNLRVKKND